MPLSALDHAALLACLQIAERDPEFVERVGGKPNWFARAEFACHCVQYRALHLKPWQTPPYLAELDDDDPDVAEARQLLRRMLDAGLSRYDPDPAKALKGRRILKK